MIVPRAEHCISRANISPPALKVLYRLKDAGYQAFLVGGAVRDLCSAHDVPFGAYAEAGHDATSPAVEILMAIFACNGDSLPADAARRLIQLANVEP